MSFKDLKEHIDIKEAENTSEFINKKTIGRPKKSEDKKRPNKICLYLTNEELALVKEKIGDTSISVVARELLLNYLKKNFD